MKSAFVTSSYFGTRESNSLVASSARESIPSTSQSQKVRKGASLLPGIVTTLLLSLPPCIAAEKAQFDTSKPNPLLLEGRIEQGSKVGDVELNGTTRQSKTGQTTSSEHDDTTTSGMTEDELEEQSIEWDQWRNRLSKAVWKKFMAKLAGNDAFMVGSHVFKLGVAPIVKLAEGSDAMYACEVMKDGQIRNLRIEKSSGNKQMNDMVLRCVWTLNGKSMLAFPAGSARKRVTVRGKLRISSDVGFVPTKYGDVEKVTVQK